MKRIKLKTLLYSKRYRKISFEDLRRIINNEKNPLNVRIKYDDYSSLPGHTSEQKAKKLFDKWHKNK